jgi:hypothetical protein
MRDPHNTTAPRAVWILPAALPPAEGAARLVRAWRAAWPTDAPWLALAPEARYAAWAEALRAAFAAEPSAAFPVPALRRCVRVAADLGAALIAGGLPADAQGGAVRPALFVNAPPAPALLRAWVEPAPVFGLAAREPHAADLAALALDLAVPRDFPI